MERCDLTFYEHLECLRRAIIRSLLALALLYLPAFYLARPLLSHITEKCIVPVMGNLNYFSPMEPLMAQLKVGLVIAATAAYPFIAYQIWKFLSPALYQRERRIAATALVTASALFAAGAAFAAIGLLPIILNFAAKIATPWLHPTLGLGNMLDFCLTLLLAFGLVFQIPLIVVVLRVTNVIQKDFLSRARPYIVVSLMIISAILTPPDIISQLALFVPSWILFELGLVVGNTLARNNS